MKWQEDGNQLSSTDAAELRALCTVEQDIVLVTPEETSGDGAAYDAGRLREERLRRLSVAEAEQDGSAQRRAKRDASAVVKYITLRFFADQEQNNKEHGVEVSIPFLASFAEVCEMLRQRFQRMVHFRYINDKNVRVEVRSEEALAAFRYQMGEEGLEKQSSVVVAQVQLLAFGSGAPPLAEQLRNGVVGSSLSHFRTIEESMKLMACVAEAVTDEARAADHARAVMQSPSGPSALLEETDHIGRTALHLAAAQGRRLLVTALLSGPKETRKAAACARDLKGRTALHYCAGEHVAITLLEAQADPSLVDLQGCGPLHINRDTNVADRLVKGKTHGAPHDASPDLRDQVSTRLPASYAYYHACYA